MVIRWPLAIFWSLAILWSLVTFCPLVSLLIKEITKIILSVNVNMIDLYKPKAAASIFEVMLSYVW